MRARVVVAAGLAAVLILGLGSAQASSLDVAGGSLTTQTSQACSPGTLAVTGSPATWAGLLFGYTGVTLTVPAACAGTDLSVTVYATTAGAVQATASRANVSAGTVTLTTSATYGGWLTTRPASSVAVTFDGWSVPASF